VNSGVCKHTTAFSLLTSLPHVPALGSTEQPQCWPFLIHPYPPHPISVPTLAWEHRPGLSCDNPSAPEMGDEGRPFRRRPLYYVANRGSDESDEGANSEDDRSPYYHHAYLSSPQQSPHPRVHPHPPALTTSFPSPYTHDNNSKHPSLSSPSSASSQAADESTPPPTTPSVTLPLSSCPPVSIKPTAQHSQDSISLGDRFPSDHSLTSNGRPRYMQPFLSRGSNARAPVESNPVGRPRTVSVICHSIEASR